MKKQKPKRESLKILLVEDDPIHAKLVKRSFENHPMDIKIYHLADGEAALNYLLRRETYAKPEKSPRPQLVLLDLRLPKVDGLEVLKKIKSSKKLRGIPVVVLTTSKADNDACKAYDYNANSYLIKPVDFEKFTEMMNDLSYYWLRWNYYPRNEKKS